LPGTIEVPLHYEFERRNLGCCNAIITWPDQKREAVQPMEQMQIVISFGSYFYHKKNADADLVLFRFLKAENGKGFSKSLLPFFLGAATRN
jgi:hypothetical protein